VARLSVVLSGLIVLASAVAASTASARSINGATLVVGRGANGARLDMTRQQVLARLGTWPSGKSALSYLRPSDGIFDVYRYPDAGRVRMFIFSFGPPFHRRAWRLRDGNRIFTKGGIDRLYRHYGRRVHRWINPETGDRNYVICSRYHHRPVRTEFLVGRFSRDRLVADVTILFIDRAADGGPLTDSRCLQQTPPRP
jgi:hypothetical protein